MEKVTVTREQLYDQVWAIPMSRLAAQYGISDVALAKTCAKLGIPVPPRGYWARLAVGQNPKRPKLPKALPDTPAEVRLGRVPVGPAGEVPSRPAPPTVKVPEGLSAPHPVVEDLAKRISEAGQTDEHGRTKVGRSWGPYVCLRRKCEKRALVLLDALFKALVDRGHEVQMTGLHKDDGDPQPVVIIQGYKLGLEVEEKLARKPHVLTPYERDMKAKYPPWNHHPKYDRHPNEDLVIRLDSAPYQYQGRKSWSDTETQRLDDLLGLAILSFEAAAEVGRRAREEAECQQREHEARERVRLRGERLQAYQQWLADDLDEMASDWATARRLREFVAAYEAFLTDETRTERVTAWCEAVREYLIEIDPLAGPLDLVAKELEPSDEALAEFAASQEEGEADGRA
jgi:hypothetical protein